MKKKIQSIILVVAMLIASALVVAGCPKPEGDTTPAAEHHEPAGEYQEPAPVEEEPAPVEGEGFGGETEHHEGEGEGEGEHEEVEDY